MNLFLVHYIPVLHSLGMLVVCLLCKNCVCIGWKNDLYTAVYREDGEKENYTTLHITLLTKWLPLSHMQFIVALKLKKVAISENIIHTIIEWAAAATASDASPFFHYKKRGPIYIIYAQPRMTPAFISNLQKHLEVNVMGFTLEIDPTN